MGELERKRNLMRRSALEKIFLPSSGDFFCCFSFYRFLSFLLWCCVCFRFYHSHMPLCTTLLMCYMFWAFFSCCYAGIAFFLLLYKSHNFFPFLIYLFSHLFDLFLKGNFFQGWALICANLVFKFTCVFQVFFI